MTTMEQPHLLARRLRVPVSLATGTCVLVTMTACWTWVGPVDVRIDTAGQPVDNFVIEWAMIFARAHDSKFISKGSLIVASEEPITLGRSSAGPLFTGFSVSAYHPEFRYAYTIGGAERGGKVTLPPIRPQRWSDYLQAEGGVGFGKVKDHLERVLLAYVPAFENERERHKLRVYLPGLEELAAQASWSPGDSSRWPNETAARDALETELSRLSRSMQ